MCENPDVQCVSALTRRETTMRQPERGVISSRLTERQIRARVSSIQKTGMPKVSDGTHEETRETRVEHAHHRHPQRGLLPERCRMPLVETRGAEEGRETAGIIPQDKMRGGSAFHVVKKAM